MVMKFYRNDKARPARSGKYYVILESGAHLIIPYSSFHNEWNVYDDEEMYDPACRITTVFCWAHRPKTDQVLLELKKEGQ